MTKRMRLTRCDVVRLTNKATGLMLDKEMNIDILIMIVAHIPVSHPNLSPQEIADLHDWFQRNRDRVTQ